MAVKLRLTESARPKQPQYRIVAAQTTLAPADGRFIEILGHYNPLHDPSEPDRRQRQGREVLSNGAQPTERVAEKLLEISGAMEQFKASK